MKGAEKSLCNLCDRLQMPFAFFYFLLKSLEVVDWFRCLLDPF